MITKQQQKRRMANIVAALEGAPAVAKNTVAPAITGTAKIGQKLTVSDGTWTGNPEPSGYQYQWRANGVDIPGANDDEFTLTDEQFGAVITCEVRALQPGGYVPKLTAATAAVGGDAPTNSVLPVITGTAQVGETLTASTGTWSAKPAAITYAFQWLADDVEIEGATQNTYVPVEGDVDAEITVTVTATNAVGSTDATSEPTEAVIAAE